MKNTFSTASGCMFFIINQFQYLYINWPAKITNQRKVKQNPVSMVIKERKCRWMGNILRREQTNITRQAIDWNPQGQEDEVDQSRPREGL